jgi:hypothetical protein
MDQRDSPDSTEATLASEPTENADTAEPAEPIDRMEPADPTERIDPAEPIDRIDPVDPMPKIELSEPIDHFAPWLSLTASILAAIPAFGGAETPGMHTLYDVVVLLVPAEGPLLMW